MPTVFWYTEGAHYLHKNGLSGADIRVLLVMTNTTADTERDKADLAAFTDLDEYDGSPYSRQALDNIALSKDAAGNRSLLDADNETFSSLGGTSAGSRNVQGVVAFINGPTDADRIPLIYFQPDTWPFTPSGGDQTLNWASDGLGEVKAV